MEGEEIPANLLDYTSTHQAGVSKQKRWTHMNIRCQHKPRFPLLPSGICLPGAAEGHQPVFVVDSHAGTVGHICCPDALQLLHPQEALVT